MPAEIVDPPPLEVAEPPAQPTGPPCDAPGFPALPMFGGEIGELANATTPQRMVMVNSTIREGLTAGGMAMTADGQSQAQVSTSYATRGGVLKAELASAGMVQLALEGCAPLPFLQLNSMVALMPQGLAGGMAQGMLLTPVGMVTGSANLYGQLSAELLTGLQPSPTSQLMLGAHAWGTPGKLCGVKGALELQSMVLDEREQVTASSALTFEYTVPRVDAGGGAVVVEPPAWSVSAFHRTSPTHSVAACYTQPAAAHASMWIGGTRQVSESVRLRGTWATTGLLSLALEMAGHRSALTLSASANTVPAEGLAPRFGATLQLSP